MKSVENNALEFNFNALKTRYGAYDENNDLTIDEAREMYYRSMNKEESTKIKSLSRVSSNLSVDDETKERLLLIKEKEQLRFKVEIFRGEGLSLIENTVLKCIAYENISKADLSGTLNAINEIIDDIEGVSQDYTLIFEDKSLEQIAQAYFSLLRELAKRGVSDLLYLSRVLYERSKNRSLPMDSLGLLELCEVWRLFVDEYIYFHDKFYIHYRQNEKYTMQFFRGSSPFKNNVRETDIIVKEHIILKDNSTRSTILRDLTKEAFLLASVRSKIKAKYGFLLSYNKDRLDRYEEVQQYLIDNYSGEVDNKPREYDIRMVFISFSTILKHLKGDYSQLLQKNLIHFGSENMTYLDVTYRLLMTLEILHSVYLQLSKVSMDKSVCQTYGISSENTTIFVGGKKKKVSYKKARDICRHQLDTLAEEVSHIRNVNR